LHPVAVDASALGVVLVDPRWSNLRVEAVDWSQTGTVDLLIRRLLWKLVFPYQMFTTENIGVITSHNGSDFVVSAKPV
jgi:hypothetical protein